MKILSIRGENLASLHGSFEIDFEAEPLGRAGLFAITGPTGAGKSTLLDAISLALYGTTPRLEAVSSRGHLVGSGDDAALLLSSTDPASLLRKGTGSCYAEVVFVGRDGKRYRAKWMVHRARGQADGRVRPSSRELEDVESGALIGRTNTEIQAEIAARIGLSYDQFCRAVLLAQGEFARFLLANEKERAELLERVTGTEIYREISIAAHHRYGEAKQALALLQQELQGVRIFSEEERREQEEALAAREAELGKARAALEEAQAAIRWYETLGARLREEQEAKEAKEAAEVRWEEAAPQREALALFEQALPLHQPIAAADGLQRKVDEGQEELGAAKGALGGAATSLAEARERAKEASSHLEAELRLQEDLAPKILEARRLDDELGRLGEELGRLEREHGGAFQRAREQELELQTLREERQGAESSRLGALEELESLGPVEAIAREWPRIQDWLLRLVELEEQRREAQDFAKAKAEEVVQLEEAARAAAEAATSASEQHQLAEAAAVEAEERAQATPRGTLRERRGALERASEIVRELQRIAADHGRLARERDDLEREVVEAGAERSTVDEERIGQAAKIELLTSQLEAAEQARQEARDALELEEQRALLREGEPCPLCGGLDHPWAGDAAIIVERLQEREGRWRELRDALQGAERRVAQLEARGAAASKLRERALGECAKREDGLRSLRVAWGSQLSTLGPQLSTLGPQLSTLGPQLSTLGPQLSTLGPQLSRLEEQLSAHETPLRAFELAKPGAQLSLEHDAAQALEPDRRDAPISLEGDGAQALATLAEVLGGLREALEGEEREAERFEGAAARARAEERTLRKQREEREREQREGAALLHAASEEVRLLRLRADEASRQQGELSQRLEPHLDGDGSWRAALAADVRRFSEGLRVQAEAWLGAERRRAEGTERLAAVEPRIEAARRLGEERDAKVQEIAAAREQLAERFASLRGERGALLGGEEVGALEAALRVELEARREAVERAQRDVALEAERHAKAGALLEATEASLRKASEELERSVQERDQALAASGLSLSEARERLAGDPAAQEERRSAIAALEQERAQRKILLEERQRARVAHEAGGKPALEEAAARAAAVELQGPCTEAEHAFHDVRNALRADDEARKHAAALLPTLEKLGAEATKWGALHELIGSASGDKFQLFAQSITLEVLLDHANVHLDELAPRYRLERVPGQGLHLQVVDRDMGDEVRAATSLSGGETFLVSLALALGLSGLSTKTRVESLFIDEGFGSLDPQTLDVALASLDALQATGRKVGVISHVQGMAERIGVQIQVQPQGSGRSSVAVVAG